MKVRIIAVAAAVLAVAASTAAVGLSSTQKASAKTESSSMIKMRGFAMVTGDASVAGKVDRDISLTGQGPGIRNRGQESEVRGQGQERGARN